VRGAETSSIPGESGFDVVEKRSALATFRIAAFGQGEAIIPNLIGGIIFSSTSSAFSLKYSEYDDQTLLHVYLGWLQLVSILV